MTTPVPRLVPHNFKCSTRLGCRSKRVCVLCHNDVLRCGYCCTECKASCHKDCAQEYLQTYSLDSEYSCRVTVNEVTVATQAKGDVKQSDCTYPDEWDISTEEILVKVDCKRHHNEYECVRFMFHDTMPERQITRIYRVQNNPLWQKYVRKKEDMSIKNEQMLFHGTKQGSVANIIQEGFDFRLSKTTNVFGRGSYFARDAALSSAYSDCDSVFLTKVLVGDLCLAHINDVRPPLKTLNSSPSLRYDTCVDKVDEPSIYVTYDRAQSYPAYIIEYSSTATNINKRKPSPAIASPPASSVNLPPKAPVALPQPQSAPNNPLQLVNVPHSNNLIPPPLTYSPNDGYSFKDALAELVRQLGRQLDRELGRDLGDIIRTVNAMG